MKRIEALYEQMAEMADEDLYLIEPEFCRELYYHIPTELGSAELCSMNQSFVKQGSVERRPACVTAFLTIVNWFAMSQRSGVWTFYEAADPNEIELTIQFLTERGDRELASIFRYGAHDYQNPKYAGNWKYPEEWIEEAREIDQWITEHETWLYGWERGLLLENQTLLCSLAFEKEYNLRK